MSGEKIAERARRLRKNQTDAKKLLWQRLRDRQVFGCKFRRQHAIGPFIADFVCVREKLIIEIDGGQHYLQAASDDSRTAYLQARGFQVLRFWNTEILQQTDSVLEVIGRSLQGRDYPSP